MSEMGTSLKVTVPYTISNIEDASVHSALCKLTVNVHRKNIVD
jgi:hypothetical protein